MIAGMARVEITFLVDADGLLRVTAKEQTTGNEASIEVKPSYGLTDEEVERMLIESFEHAEDDLAARNLAHRARRGRAHPRGDPPGVRRPTPRCSTDDVARRGRGRDGAARGARWRASDYLAIRAAIEALDIATKPFAQLRMNRAVDAQLRGKTLDEAEATSPHADASAA